MSVYNGMTVNGRLSAAKLLESFDESVKQDKNKVMEIPISVELSAKDAKNCCESIFNNPVKYGY